MKKIPKICRLKLTKSQKEKLSELFEYAKSQAEIGKMGLIVMHPVERKHPMERIATDATLTAGFVESKYAKEISRLMGKARKEKKASFEL